MDDSPLLSIGEVARRAGVAASSIRYYESIGVLPEPARVHGRRCYDHDVLGRLAFVAVAQSAGFKLEEIKELARGVEGEEGMGELMRTLSRQKLAEVEAMLARATAMKGWLEVANTCECESPAECTLFDGLAVIQVDGCRRQA